MEPETIDTSVVSISNPPGSMEANLATTAPTELENDKTPKMPSTSMKEDAQYTNTAASPRLTDALEALLGGLDTPPSELELLEIPDTVSRVANGADHTPIPVNESASRDATSIPVNLQLDNAPAPAQGGVLAHIVDAIPETDGLAVGTEIKSLQDAETLPNTATTTSQTQNVASGISADVLMVNASMEEISQEESLPKSEDIQMNETDTKIEAAATNLPEVEPILEFDAAQLDATDVAMGEDGEGDAEHPEWEVDSSPISSSDDSSDDSSSDDSEDGDNTYKLLSPEEQARILMADGGSDDEGTAKGKGASGGQLRTKNEVPEVVIPKPDVQITPEMEIVNLGVIETIVENIALIKARTSGEYRVLESGSVLCLEDRSIIGVVAEPLGRVQQPLYSVLFTNSGELKAAGLSLGTKVFYTEKFATFVFTQALKAYKGSDASNIHDEEVGDEEMEFSDDEAELEHKRKVKQAKRGTRGRDGGFGRGGHPLQQQHDANASVNYDEAEDGPYRPLARPVGLINSLGHVEAPQEGEDFGARHVREQSRGGGRGDRGGARGDRGRGRGDRGRGDRGGRGRGGFRGGPDNGGGRNSGYSQPSQNRPTSSHQQSPPSFNQNLPANGFPVPPAPNSFNAPQQQFSPNQSQFPAWPQFPPPPPQYQAQPFQQANFQQAFQTVQQMQQMQQQMQNGWPMPLIPPMSGGAFLNPAFFSGNNQGGNNQGGNNQGGNNGGQWNQQNQQGRGRGGQNGGNGGNGILKREEGDRY